MDHPRKNSKTKHDDRIILHFDLDCFYAQVFENKRPPLKSLPLGIRQKSLLATCNYPARRLGVKKLMSISSAKAICPDLVIVDGEDLTPFRDVSKRLYSLLRSYSWNDKVERLGLDEVWIDVSDLVEYNVEFLNRNDLGNSWFCLDKQNPERGFGFDGRGFAGEVYGGDYFGVEKGEEDGGDGGSERQQLELLTTKLLLASHLAFHLRMKIEEEGYTTACGISTNKLLAKLVGNLNKPRNQTTLLSCGPDGERTVGRFMGSHQLGKIPGIGGRTAAILSEWFISQSYPGPKLNPNSMKMDPKSITVAHLLAHPDLTPSKLDSLLSPLPGTSGTTTPGKHIHSLLNGHDPSPVKPARTLPTQISIEDTYHACPLVSLVQIRSELVKITASLLKRIKTDLWDEENKRWMARPKTLRLTTRPRVNPKEGKGYGYLRVSKSGALSGYVFGVVNGDAKANGGDGVANGGGDGDGYGGGNNTVAMAMTQQIVERLVTETLLPMFHQLNPINPKERAKGYSIGLLNVCVTNMDSVDLTASGGGGRGGGRDIKDMFTRAREFTVYDHDHYHDPDSDQHPNQRQHHLVDNYDADGDEKQIGSGAEPLGGLDMDAEDVEVDGNRQQQDTDSIPDGYEQGDDTRLPTSTTTIDYFHIEDDDERWDNQEDEEDNVWDNQKQDGTCDTNEETNEEEYGSGTGGISGGGSGGGDGIKCPLCNHFIPFFAISAHERFHSMEED